MSRARFSKDYRTYGEWLKAQPRDTRYAKEIIRKHNLNPSATLSSLRKMRLSDISPAFNLFNKLSYEKGKFLTSAAKEQKINVQNTPKHLGKAIYKKNGRWVATIIDSIRIGRWLYSNGKRISVVIKSSRYAPLRTVLIVLEFLLFILKQHLMNILIYILGNMTPQYPYY